MKKKVIYLVVFILSILILKFTNSYLFGTSPDIHKYIMARSLSEQNLKDSLGTALSSNTDFKQVTKDSLMFNTRVLGTKRKAVFKGITYFENEKWVFHNVSYILLNKETNLDSLESF